MCKFAGLRILANIGNVCLQGQFQDSQIDGNFMFGGLQKGDFSPRVTPGEKKENV